MFSTRYEAAKLVEEEQDAEIEEAERRLQANRDAAKDRASSAARGKRKEQAGEWCESDSGLLWNPAESSTLDDSADDRAALQACRQEAAAMAGNPIGASSQDDDENYTKGKQEGWEMCRISNTVQLLMCAGIGNGNLNTRSYFA
jgi:hypothetical protein